MSEDPSRGGNDLLTLALANSVCVSWGGGGNGYLGSRFRARQMSTSGWADLTAGHRRRLAGNISSGILNFQHIPDPEKGHMSQLHPSLSLKLNLTPPPSLKERGRNRFNQSRTVKCAS